MARLGSAVRISANLQKIPRLVGRLGSGPRIRGSVRMRSTDSASCQIFVLTAREKSWEGNCPR